jgi:hypothetical protein
LGAGPAVQGADGVGAAHASVALEVRLQSIYVFTAAAADTAAVCGQASASTALDSSHASPPIDV